MERCDSCGAGLTPGAQWCGQCYARLPVAVGTTAGGQTVVPNRFSATPAPAAAADPALPVTHRYTRWRRTDTTFGPLGRLLCTLGLVGPFLFLVAMGVLTVDPFVLAGAAIWGGVIMPWGLRDTWRAGRLRTG